MKLINLMKIADEGYRKDFTESGLMRFVDPEGIPLHRQVNRQNPSGDLLAEFVVQELWETYDDEASDQEQLATAREATLKAAQRLRDVMVAFTFSKLYQISEY